MYNVLIADDEPYIGKGLSSLLTGAGLDIGAIHTALSGEEALDLLRFEEIDLLITDIQMGAMSGIDLMHQAKLVKPWVQTIVISAHETFHYAQMAMRLGARDYLVKPLNGDHFLDVVRGVLLEMNKPEPVREANLAELRSDFRLEPPDGERAELLAGLIRPDADAARAFRELEARGVRLDGPYFAVIRILLHLPDARMRDVGDVELLRYAALNVASEALGSAWRHEAFYAGERELAVILQWSERQYEDPHIHRTDQLDMIGRTLQRAIERTIAVPCVVGVSQLLKSVAFLPELAEQARKAASCHADHPDHFVFYYGDFNWSLYEKEPPEGEPWKLQHNLIVEKAVAYLEAHYAQKGLTLNEVAQRIHVSPNYLSYLFKRHVGCTLWDYVIKLRMEESKRLLLGGDLRRYEIAERVGYESPEHFSKIFKKYYGVSPSEIKK